MRVNFEHYENNDKYFWVIRFHLFEKIPKTKEQIAYEKMMSTEYAVKVRYSLVDNVKNFKVSLEFNSIGLQDSETIVVDGDTVVIFDFHPNVENIILKQDVFKF